MKNLTKNISIVTLLTSGLLASSTAFAALGTVTDAGVTDANIQENDEVTLGFSHPQSLAVSQPNNEVNRGSNGVINRTWHVVTNNAVKVKITGRSPTATTGTNEFPVFYKAEVDANGAILANQFDHLVTNFAASVDVSGTDGSSDGSQSTNAKAIWGGGTDPVSGAVNTASLATNTVAQDTVNTAVVTGTPAALVASGFTDNFGSIMPNDNGRFSFTLSSKGVGDVATTQSGDYQITIVTSFMADEKGNYTILPSTAETANADGTATAGFLTATQAYTTTGTNGLGGVAADNSQFSFVSSTSVGQTVSTTTGELSGGVEQSPDVLSDALTTDGTKATNATKY